MNKNILIIGALIVALLLFSKFGGIKMGTEDKVFRQGQVRLLEPAEFANLAKAEDNFLLDVHIPEQTHLPGTDAFIPYNEISQNLDKLPDDKSTPVLVYCRSGSMSASASQELAELGYTSVYDLKGGVDAYKELNAQVVITPGNQALGAVIYGDVAETTFTLTNFTPLPLKVTRVSTSCGCTKAEVDEREVGAYETTEINVSFDPAVHGDATDVGDITRTIYIDTDNPNFPQLTSTITANVIKK